MSEAVDVGSLFEDAANAGDISTPTFQLLKTHDIGVNVNAALGVSVDGLDAGEAVFVTFIIDDSSSIGYHSNDKKVRDGYNFVIDSLRKSKVKDNILVHSVKLNSGILHPYLKLDDADKLDTSNYNANGGTPLRDVMFSTLATVLAKWQDYTNNGIDARTITVIITDGADYGSRIRANEVASLVNDMISMEQHIVAAMGIDDGHTNFTSVFKELGVLDNWILTPANTAEEIRKAFEIISSSTVKASQSAMNFSQTNAGGFGGFSS